MFEKLKEIIIRKLESKNFNFKKFIFTLFVIEYILIVMLIAWFESVSVYAATSHPQLTEQYQYYITKLRDDGKYQCYLLEHNQYALDDYDHMFNIGVGTTLKSYLSDDDMQTWDYVSTWNVANDDYFHCDNVYEANFTIYDYEDETEIKYEPIQEGYEDYYIDDNANILDNIDSLLSLEKRYEYNLKSQYFIRTYLQGDERILNEEQSSQNFGNTKKDSGRGSILIDIIVLENGNYRVGISLSGNFLKQLPYENHYLIIQRFKNKCMSQFNSQNLFVFLKDMYEEILWEPIYYNYSNNVNTDEIISKFNLKFKRNLTNAGVPETYQLENGKLDKVSTSQLELKSDVFDRLLNNVYLDDNYGLVDNTDVPDNGLFKSYNYPCKNCDNHIWFFDLDNPLSSPTPEPTITSPPPAPSGTGNNPLITPTPSLDPSATPFPELLYDTDNFFDGIENRIAPGVLQDSYKKLLDMDTTRGEPPVITVNLYKLIKAATENFDPDMNIPFADEESPIIDFGLINESFMFEEKGIFDYFRLILGFGMILITLKHCYDKVYGGAILD